MPVGRFLNSRMAREGAWAASGQVTSAVAAVVSIRIMTELLPPEEFGRLTLLLGVSALALGLTATPKLQALIRYFADWALAERINVLRRVGHRIILRLVAIAALIIAIGWLAFGPLIGGAWFTGMLIAALLVADSMRSFELSLFNAARRQRAAAVIYAADAWSRPLMAIAAVFAFGSTANGALAGYVAGTALVIIVMRLTMQLEGTEPAASDVSTSASIMRERDLAAAIHRYAWPLAPLALFAWISGAGDRYVIGGMLGLAEAGLYAAAYGLASRPFMMLAGIIELTVRPVLQNAIAAGDHILIDRMKLVFLLMVASGSICGVLCFFVLSEVVAHLLLAEEYREATKLMPWIALGYALYVTSNVFSRLCYAFDDTRAVLFLTVAGAVIGLSVLAPAIHFGGLWGAAAAVPIRFGVELVLSLKLARHAERRFFARRASEVIPTR
jgi:O-antigen/teichoic acid export membrane protein